MKKLIHRIANIYLVISLLGLLVFISILSVEIVLRYFFSNSIIWSQEFFSILICWITFLGFGKILVDQEDIMITFLMKKISESKQRIVSIFNSILMVFTSSVLLYYSTMLTIRHMENTTTIMKWPSALFYIPIVLLMILVVLTSIYNTYLAYKSELNLFTGEEEE
ncbi:TRAP transporter small permease [Oceanobacillus senegalensis]|uniref:TRAP transporter small permease n=1 Tax=Oceanobacillus senegalensis TaxID=1936063 RepID=UPI000A3134CD|nr:TRAP transporter small permease subunit [Oceanobacillus senegalensis]